MLTRILRYVVLVIAFILWAGGVSSTVLHGLYQIGVVGDDYRFGDLYRLSALTRFKQEQPVCQPSHRGSDTSSTHLYLIGDSFSEPQRLSQDDFAVSHYQRVAWDHQQRAQLDPTKRNVLLIESVERHFREHFARPVNELVVEADTSRMPILRPTLKQRISEEVHLSDVEERLETVLFSRDWAFWFKELKADLTLCWFDRNASVSLSKDRQAIFLKLDTDTTKRLNSSFSHLPDQEVNALVDSVNATAAHYKRLGFDAVYLSIIPNKTTIMEPNRGVYNHLIERIQSNPRLQVPTINSYDAYKRAPLSPYLKSDTHWNCEGRALWLKQVRQVIKV